MTNILFVFGTRPEAIKLAPVIVRMKQDQMINITVCSTGQHREMLKPVLDFFEIRVDHDLMLMKDNQKLSDLTAEIVREVGVVIRDVKPEWLIVQGDTTTAFASAIAGFYERIKVVHVEAGLRSLDLQSPFPEELNRVMVSKIAHTHFCPTREAYGQLRKEGVINNLHIVGNTVVDAIQQSIVKIKTEGSIARKRFLVDIDFSKRIILVTCHRRENFGDPFVRICQALLELVARARNVQVVYPVHLNPNVKSVAEKLLQHPDIKLIPPLSYPDLISLMENSYLILTDSGGIQEEAPSLKKPVLVLRDVTERMEGVIAGSAKLVGTDSKKIVDESIKLLEDENQYHSMVAVNNPYGDGRSAERIAKVLKGEPYEEFVAKR
jgi:UDP-N-acetylglucosamine 2-epimerase (non-hydrolysing)